MCEKKVCTKCKAEKDLTLYGNSKASKDGKAPTCKKCLKDDRDRNRDKLNARRRKYYENNKELEKAKRRSHYKNNKEASAIKCKAYYQNNKEKFRYKQDSYDRNKRANDPLFKLSGNLRNLIRIRIQKRGWEKTSKTQDILGCSFKVMESHLNNNPYNFKFGDKGLDLDHIIPLSTATTEEEMIKLNHYTNFQLLPSVYNQDIKKSNPWDKEDFENWLKINS